VLQFKQRLHSICNGKDKDFASVKSSIHFGKLNNKNIKEATAYLALGLVASAAKRCGIFNTNISSKV
jgi:hypothetical protein